MHTNTDNTYSNRLMEQSLRGGRTAGYLAASPGGALQRTKVEGVSTTADPRVGNNNMARRETKGGSSSNSSAQSSKNKGRPGTASSSAIQPASSLSHQGSII